MYWNEPAAGPLGVNISASRFKLHFQKFENVVLACETTSVHGPQCNFCPRKTTSVHGRQHLLQHDTSFIAFSMNELKINKRTQNRKTLPTEQKISWPKEFFTWAIGRLPFFSSCSRYFYPIFVDAPARAFWSQALDWLVGSFWTAIWHKDAILWFVVPSQGKPALFLTHSGYHWNREKMSVFLNKKIQQVLYEVLDLADI